MHKILIIEDDSDINKVITDTLTTSGYETTSAYSGTEGLMHLRQNTFDLVILDLMLPGLDGEELIVKFRKELESDTPVIILSAKDKLDHKLDLFERGADDYMTKPFEIEELLARVSVQLKRSSNKMKETMHQHKQLKVNSDTLEIHINDTPIVFTRKEFKIIELLIKNPTRIFSKEDLYEMAWDELYIGEDKTVTVHVSNIRHKLKEVTDEPYIDTVWGIGFKLSK